MTLPLVLMALLAAADADDFVLPLPVSASALEKATTYVRQDRVVLYIANGTGKGFERTFAHGPVKRAAGRSVEHGYVVTLEPRSDAASLREALQKRLDPVGLVVDAAPPAEESAPLPWNLDTTAEPAPKLPVAVDVSRHAPTLLATAFLALVSAVGGMLVLWRRRAQPDKSDATIQVLAMRSLGTKHKLALIDTCGERLLIAASDRGVALLSHLQHPSLVDENGADDTPFAATLPYQSADKRGIIAFDPTHSGDAR